ncbi:MAG: ribosome silencing factor [Dehalococcoidia bacterium]
MTNPHALEGVDLAQRIVDELSDRQVEDITQIDVSKVAGFTDFFVIGTADNERQLRAVIETLDQNLGRDGVRLKTREGQPDSGWVLLDFGDVIVHLFSRDARAFYRLDDLWGRSAPVVRFT